MFSSKIFLEKLLIVCYLGINRVDERQFQVQNSEPKIFRGIVEIHLRFCLKKVCFF